MKKKLLALMLGAALVFSLAACGNQQSTPPQQDTPSQSSGTESDTSAPTEPDTTPVQPDADGKTLVVYFSVPETTSAENMNAEEEYSTVVIDGEVLGNTQYVAHLIQQATGGDIFRIEPVTPYPMNHAELEEVATEEKRQNAMPEIAAQVEDMDQYTTVFLGYPNWYADMPRIIYSFLDQYDLSGKTIVPFVTSGGSGFSNTISTIQDLEPDATVITDGYSISRTRMEDAETGVMDWLTGLGYANQ